MKLSPGETRVAEVPLRGEGSGEDGSDEGEEVDVGEAGVGV